MAGRALPRIARAANLAMRHRLAQPGRSSVHRRLPTDPDTEVLPDALATRVLARASELDAAFATGTVANLRSAAVEAGISSRAFDAALAEVRAADKALDQAPVVTASARTRSGG